MRFQKSIRIAPGIRIYLSKLGVGFSVGPKGLKLGVDGKGRRYSSVGIPGTGISQRSYVKAGEDGHTPEENQRAGTGEPGRPGLSHGQADRQACGIFGTGSNRMPRSCCFAARSDSIPHLERCLVARGFSDPTVRAKAD